jgi:hypothetical protein
MINPDEITSQNNLQKGLNIKPEVLPTKTTAPIPLITEPLVNEPPSMPKFGAEATSYYQTLQPRMAELGKAEGELKKFEMQNEAEKTRNQFEATKVYKTNVDALNLTAEQKENEYPRPEFHPTKENLASLGALFSMVSTLGMIVGASGKAGANNAMNAMTGMLKGWQSGRKDLYEKEVKEFDKEYKRITDIRNEIQKKLEKSIALESTNKELAFLERESARQLAGPNTVLDLTIARQGAMAGIDLIKGAFNIDAQYKKLESDAKNRSEDRALRLEIAKLKSSGKGGAANDRYAFNINESFAQAATDVLNIAQMPKDTFLGTFAGLTGQSGDTLTSSLRNTFARKALTKDDERLMQQVVSGLEFNMSRALGGGYASSGAKYMIDIYKQQVPKQGDSPIVTAMFLARIKQELGVLAKSFNGHPGATPKYVQQMDDYMNEMNKAIPFNVIDVTKAARQNKTTISDQATKIANAQSNMSLPLDRSQENVQNSMSNASSQKYSVDGREIIPKGNKWVFKDNGKDVE